MPPYTPVDMNIFLQRHQEAMDRTASTGLKSWKPMSGPAGGHPLRNIIRVMPPHESMGGNPLLYFRVHFSLGPQQDTAAPCLEFFKKFCPACQQSNEYFAKSRQAEQEGNLQHAKAWKDLAFTTKAKHRYGANVVDLGKPEAGVQPWFFGVELQEKLALCFYDDDRQFRDITDPHTGRDVIIDVVKKADSDFNDYPVFKTKEAASALMDMGWLDQIIDLPSEVIHEPSEEEVRAAMQGHRIQRAGATVRPGALSPAPGPVTPRVVGTASTASPRAISAAPPPAAGAPVTPMTTQPPAAGRGGRGRRVMVPPQTVPDPRQAVIPGTEAAVATEPGPVVAAAAAPRVARTPVTDDLPLDQNGSATFWARSIALLAEAGVAEQPQWVKDIATLKTVKVPGCYMREFEVSDKGCQGCRVVLSCAAVVKGWVAPDLVDPRKL